MSAQQASYPLAVLIVLLLAGCGAAVQPSDVNHAAEQCAHRGGWTHVARHERGRILDITCADKSGIELRFESAP